MKISRNFRTTALIALFLVFTALWQNCSPIKIKPTATNQSVSCTDADDYKIAVSQAIGAAQMDLSIKQINNGETSIYLNDKATWSIGTYTATGPQTSYNLSTPPQCTSPLQIKVQFETECGTAILKIADYIDSRCQSHPPTEDPPTQVTCPTPPAGLTLQPTAVVYPNSPFINWTVPAINYSDIFSIDMSGESSGGVMTQTPPYTTPAEWPGAGGGRIMILHKDYYLALKFTIPENTPFVSGYWRTDGPATISYAPRAKVSMTISECPGVFNPEKIRAGCKVDSSSPLEGGLVSWKISTANLTGSCALQKGRTYYLNIINAPLTNTSQSYCESRRCMNQITTMNSRF